MAGMKRLLMSVAEHTPVAALYRSAREEWRFSHAVFAETPFGYRFAGLPAMIAGTFEQQERAALRDHLASADLFVDIGAFYGYFTCMACSLGKPAIAVEPVPATLRYLCANLHVNGWGSGVEIYPVGLADKPGLASLFGAGSAASLVPGWGGASRFFQRTIPLSTLDILLGDRFRGQRLVIKMDVEGAEYAALQGAVGILQAVPRPVWLVEIMPSVYRGQAGEGPPTPNSPFGSPDPRRNARFLDTFELFWALGYKAVAVDRQEKELSRSELQAYASTDARQGWATDNYLLTSAE
jgi:FkbM family methyltransferase